MFATTVLAKRPHSGTGTPLVHQLQIAINVDGRENIVRPILALDTGWAGSRSGRPASATDRRPSGRGNVLYDLADFPPSLFTLNTWNSNRGETPLEGCDTRHT